jgi:hypothetical protein
VVVGNKPSEHVSNLRGGGAFVPAAMSATRKPLMKTVFVLCAATVALVQATPSSPPLSTKGSELDALEKKLLGTWYGPSCGGDYTFGRDGTFVLQHYTPGNNTLTGTWAIRWDALPPTLLLTYKTSDIQTRDATRSEFAYLGKSRPLKLFELNNEEFAYRSNEDKLEWRFTRRADEGGSTKQVE